MKKLLVFIIFSAITLTVGLAFHSDKQEVEPSEPTEEQAAVINDPNSDALSLANVYLEQKHYDKALEFGKKAVKEMPQSSSAHLALAMALRFKMQDNAPFAMMNVGSYREALKKSIELDSNNLDARVEEIGFLLGAPGIAGGDKEKALKKADELIAIHKEKGLLMKSYVFKVTQKHNEQIRTLNQLIELDPLETQYQFNKARALGRLERHEEAAAMHETLLKTEPDRLANHFFLAMNYIKAGKNYSKAISLLDTYIKQPETQENPDFAASALFYKGLAQKELGQTENARNSLQTALTLNPSHKRAKKLLKSL